MQELQGYLAGSSVIPGVDATPGKGSSVPIYILGSSLFGARLAAVLGLPYAFASHFSPQALRQAVATYRHEFQPSAQQAEPYVIAGVNAIVADTDEDAQAQALTVRRARVRMFVQKGITLTDEQADDILASPQGHQIAEMMRYSAAGTPEAVREYLDSFAVHADADELMVAPSSPGIEARLRSLELLADVSGLVPA